MSLGWVFHPRFLEHNTGPDHPERSERLVAIRQAVEESGLMARLVPLEFGPASPEVIGQVHEPAYVALMSESCETGMGYVGSPDTTICVRSYDAALLAVGGALAACDAVMDGRVRRAFCAVRPPGHHAERDLAMGFCLFNNIAIAAEHLVRRHGLARVAIVDFDVHHGNGTQHLFESRPDVLFISLHQHPRTLFPGTGFAHERGVGPGLGFTLNVPMAPGDGDAEYRRAFQDQVMPALRRFAPQFLLASAGFDAVRADPLAQINLEPASYEWITRDLVSIADECCQGRLVSVLEGGYHLEALGQSVVIHLKGLMEGL